MKKKNVVLAAVTLTATALIGAAITALLLGHSEAFTVLRDLTILAAVAALVQIMKIFYEEIEALREELCIADVNAIRNREAFKEVSRDAREAWEEVERLEGDLVMANNWLGEILNQANNETRRAKIYEALWLCAKGRASSNFALPAVSPVLTKEEVAWRYVRQLEQLMAAYDEVDPKPVAKKVAAKPANKRGHRCGTSTPSPRERFHYLNR